MTSEWTKNGTTLSKGRNQLRKRNIFLVLAVRFKVLSGNTIATNLSTRMSTKLRIDTTYETARE